MQFSCCCSNFLFNLCCLRSLTLHRKQYLHCALYHKALGGFRSTKERLCKNRATKNSTITSVCTDWTLYINDRGWTNITKISPLLLHSFVDRISIMILQIYKRKQRGSVELEKESSRNLNNREKNLSDQLTKKN